MQSWTGSITRNLKLYTLQPHLTKTYCVLPCRNMIILLQLSLVHLEIRRQKVMRRMGTYVRYRTTSKLLS